MRGYVPYAMAAVLATATTLGAVKTSTAGAFPVDTVTPTTVASQDVIQAHWNGGGAFFAGAALGLFGAAVANSYYYPGYGYYPSYAYAPYYGYGAYPHYAYYGHYGYGYRPYYRHYGYGYYPRYRHYGYWGRRYW